jgi:hypothetical protein
MNPIEGCAGIDDAEGEKIHPDEYSTDEQEQALDSANGAVVWTLENQGFTEHC